MQKTILCIAGLAVGGFAPYHFVDVRKPITDPNAALILSIPFRPKTPLPEWATPAEITCATVTAYNEARGEGAKGWAAVVHTMLNRRRDPLFPKTLCGIMRQRTKTGCNFSWMCDGKQHPINDAALYYRIRHTVIDTIAGKVKDPTSGAKYFCTVKYCLREKASEFFNKLAARPGMRIVALNRQAFYTAEAERKISFLEYMNNRAAPVTQ